MDGQTSGWGLKLQDFINVAVVNMAKSGRSTKSYIEEGLWAQVLDKVIPGDWVFIQFGHNDQKLEDPARGTRPKHEYQENLTMFVKNVEEKKATPILVTSVSRRTFDEFGKIYNSLGDYPSVVKDLGKKLNIMCVDLQEATKNLYEETGIEASKKFFSWYDKVQVGDADNTHFNEVGAMKIAELFVKIITELGIFKTIVGHEDAQYEE